MRIYNPTYKKIAIDWDNVELPVNEGTPFSASGTIANTSDAIGLCPVYIWKKPIDEEVYILIGGDVYQSEVEEAFGAELTDDAIASMGGINFYENDGTIDKASGGGGGTGSGTMVLTYNQQTGLLNKTYEEIAEALSSGIIPVFGFHIENEGHYVDAVYCVMSADGESGSGYQVIAFTTSMTGGALELYPMRFYCESTTDYPAMTED